MARARDSHGRFLPATKEGDIEEIQAMLREGVEERKIRLALMQARKVSEFSAWRWVKRAKKGMGGENNGSKKNDRA